ncbi:MAG: restriction endonuclease, partial [Ignavibacteriaceae bacterium]|nr:restriction endonuclease [Ignavibacteriaceae bacterium]
NYNSEIKKAVNIFWGVRDNQYRNQNKQDSGTRGAVTGKKQLDGFVELFRKISLELGIPDKYIFTKKTVLPGYFRPAKDWDFLVLSPQNEILVCLEFKSQVGSFGNNFNNRVEEAIGNSTDFWTAFREKAFNTSAIKPMIGYFIIVEKTEKSTSPVKVSEPHFKVMNIFNGTSYLDRYSIFCERLVREKLYDITAVMWTSKDINQIQFGDFNPAISSKTFIDSFAGFLLGKKSLFNEKS